jgi:alpha-tubulin suppressor-like RCC1 family protein
VQSSIILYVAPAGVISIDGGEKHALALKADGSVVAWGWNFFGQLGNGNTTDSNTPETVSGLSDVVSVAAGSYHSLALKSDGTVWAWGYNGNGQLGNGTYSPSNVPVQVSGLSDVTTIYAGSYHSMALKSDGTVWAWGDNSGGQLGDGSYTSTNSPVQVTGLSMVTSFSGGQYHSVARTADGSVWSWGINGNGQLGDGTNANSAVPVQVSGMAGATAVAVMLYDSVALKSDGTVWTWGNGGNGRLGNGSPSDTNVPVQVTGLLDAKEIAAGDSHALALRSNGTVVAWGFNGAGQLGDGSNTDRTTPVAVTAISDVAMVSCGGQFSLALLSDGTIRTWGLNDKGQLGDNTLSDSNVPVMTLFVLPPGPTNATTNNSVLMSRIQAGVSSDVTVGFGIPAADAPMSGVLTVTFPAGFVVQGPPTSGSACLGSFGYSGQTVYATKTACSGAILLGGFTVTNPGAPGQYLISWVNDDPGEAVVAIVDSDQVTVDATVSPTITFDLDTNTTGADTSAPYTVALGALTIGAVNHSNNSTVNSIYAQLDTNATSGAQVTVLSANAALKSASVPGDTIPNSAALMAFGTANYGICVNAVTAPSAATGFFNPSAPYNAGTCDPAGSANDVQALSTGIPTPILDSASAPLTSGAAEILVNAAISTSTAAHSDYADVLTFVATGTF